MLTHPTKAWEANNITYYPNNTWNTTIKASHNKRNNQTTTWHPIINHMKFNSYIQNIIINQLVNSKSKIHSTAQWNKNNIRSIFQHLAAPDQHFEDYSSYHKTDWATPLRISQENIIYFKIHSGRYLYRNIIIITFPKIIWKYLKLFSKQINSHFKIPF